MVLLRKGLEAMRYIVKDRGICFCAKGRIAYMTESMIAPAMAVARLCITKWMVAILRMTQMLKAT